MSTLRHNGPGPLYELRKTAYLTGDDEGGKEVPSVLFGRYKSEAEGLKEAAKLSLDPDWHYIGRIYITFSEPGYWPQWGDDDSYGHGGQKYLNEFPEFVPSPPPTHQ